MQLTILPRHGASRDDAKLATAQVERGTRQHLAVSVHDHPGIQRRMQMADVVAQPFVERTVHRCTRCFAFGSPSRGILEVLSFIGFRCGASGNAPPFTRSVQRARKSREQVRLEYDLLDPDGLSGRGGMRERLAKLWLGAGADD